MTTDETLERLKSEAIAAVEAALPKPAQHRLFEGVPLSHDDIRRLHDQMVAARHRLADPPSEEPRRRSDGDTQRGGRGATRLRKGGGAVVSGPYQRT